MDLRTHHRTFSSQIPRAGSSLSRLPCALSVCLALALGLLLGGCSKGVSESTIAFVTLDQVRELQARATVDPRALLLIDPRPDRHFAEGHIPGAVSVQLPEVPSFGGRDPRIAAHSNIIVYGENPASPTARAMTKRLLSIGYSGVRMFSGGLAAWRAADLPIATSLSRDEDPPSTPGG